jgi:hypothetical protein
MPTFNARSGAERHAVSSLRHYFAVNGPQAPTPLLKCSTAIAGTKQKQ